MGDGQEMEIGQEMMGNIDKRVSSENRNAIFPIAHSRDCRRRASHKLACLTARLSLRFRAIFAVRFRAILTRFRAILTLFGLILALFGLILALLSLVFAHFRLAFAVRIAVRRK
jgi:uncharacterized membrane protein